MRYEALTPEDYIAQLPQPRQDAVAALRRTVRGHLPEGLSPGTDYCYQAVSSCGDSTLKSRLQVFRTQPADYAPLSFAVTSETGGSQSPLRVMESLGEAASLRPLCAVFEKYQVDIVFTSHAIVYERSHPLTQDALDFGKGVRYIVAGGAGAHPEWFHHKKAWHTAKSRAVPHFLHVSVTLSQLELQAIDFEGRLFDTLTLDKTQRQGAQSGGCVDD